MTTGIGSTIRRLVTLECIHDFNTMDQQEKQEVMAKVAVVGLVTLGLGLLAGLISSKLMWAIPLATVLAMGVAFSVNTDPANRGVAPWIASVLNWLRGSP